jgi:hypothetical protein
MMSATAGKRRLLLYSRGSLLIDASTKGLEWRSRLKMWHYYCRGFSSSVLAVELLFKNYAGTGATT